MDGYKLQDVAANHDSVVKVASRESINSTSNHPGPCTPNQMEENVSSHLENPQTQYQVKQRFGGGSAAKVCPL